VKRRTYLTAAGAAVAATAGCTSIGGSTTTYLEPTERTEAASGQLPYPTNGDTLPSVTLTDPLAETAITTTQFDRDVVMTFFYSNCQTVCPLLISTLQQLQASASDGGYAEDVVFLAVTFDPERDDAEQLRGYADRMDVDPTADNWHFLRPDSPQQATEVVQETYGVRFDRTHPEDMDMYMFDHFAAILLANENDYVERAYTGQQRVARWQPIREDLERLRDRER
jgi:protein SCO1/2